MQVPASQRVTTIRVIITLFEEVLVLNGGDRSIVIVGIAAVEIVEIVEIVAIVAIVAVETEGIVTVETEGIGGSITGATKAIATATAATTIIIIAAATMTGPGTNPILFVEFVLVDFVTR